MQILKILFCILTGATGLCSLASGEERGNWLPLKNDKNDVAESNSSYGVTPIGAYTPTYGFIFGGAGFIFPKKGRMGLDTHLLVAEATNTGQFNFSFTRANDWTKFWGYSIDANYNDFFTSFYGEGDRTSTTAQDFDQKFFKLHEGVLYHFDEISSLETFVETRSRADLGLETNPQIHLAPNETRSIVGLAYSHDTRDSVVNSRSGHYALAQAQASMGNGTTPQFQQIELEYRNFYELGARWVLGLRAEAAATIGTPSYDYEYNLGGIERLRGYLHNRFRGSQYYLTGYEVRKDLYKDYLQVVTFADVGDVKYVSYLGPRTAFGVGLRVGLPPDWAMKFRIDYAQGDDQRGIFATFGQAF